MQSLYSAHTGNDVISAYQELVRRDVEYILTGQCLSSSDITSIVSNNNILQRIMNLQLLVPCCYGNQYCNCSGGYRTLHGVLIKSLLNLKFYPFVEYMPLVEYEVIRDDSTNEPGIKEFRHDINQMSIDKLIAQIRNISSCNSKIREASIVVLEAFKAAGVPNVSAYQADYIFAYIANKCTNSVKHYVIVAPTGSGKTLIFAFMSLFESLLGNRSIIVYPRKQLAEDQANVLLKYIYYVRNALQNYKWSSIFQFNIPTVSIVDGDDPNNLNQYLRSAGSVQQNLVSLNNLIKKSLKCPLDNSELYIDISSGTIKCNYGHKIDYLYVFKDDLVKNKPDIIITNRFIILTRLLHKNVDIKSFLKQVKLLIFDEAHVYINLEGGDTAYLIDNLRHLIQNLFNYDVNFVLSSATIPKPLDYAEDLLRVNKASIEYFDYNSPNYISTTTRLLIPILLLPTPSFSAETVAQFVALATLLWTHNYNAKALMFVDSREEISRLRHYLKEVILSRGGIDSPAGLRRPGDIIYYHTSQGIATLKQHPYYSKYNVDCNALWDELVIHPANKTNLLSMSNWPDILNNELEAHYAWITGAQRSQLFNQFRKGDVKMLISTSTLELGIDIPDVSVIIQYKLPFRRESFIQRLGRAGRNPGSFRIVIGVVVLSQSPTSAAYMYDRDLAKSLVDISKLPKLPVNINNYKLMLKYEFYKLLIQHKLNGGNTHYPTW